MCLIHIKKTSRVPGTVAGEYRAAKNSPDCGKENTAGRLKFVQFDFRFPQHGSDEEIRVKRKKVKAQSAENFSVVRLGLCASPVGAFDGGRGIYPTGEKTSIYSFVTYVTR